MSLFHEIKIKEVIKETSDASTLVFAIPETLKETFQYKAGQYVTISISVRGKEERRAYSFSSSPFVDQDLAITVKKVDDGAVSPILNDRMRSGDTVLLMPPMGKFTVPIESNNQKHYILFGGGSGITPLYSIIKSILHQEPKSTICLVYANRNKDSIIFDKQLSEDENRHSDRFKIIPILEEAFENYNGLTGRLNANQYAAIAKQETKTDRETEYLICGPSGMMEQVKKGLEGLNIAKENIHLEYFTAPAASPTEPVPIIPSTETQDESGKHFAAIEFNGKHFHIEIPKGQTILEAAKDQDVDPPYACQMGICTTCRAKLLEGEARMDEREGLSDAEIADGYILTCQAHAISGHIKIKYE
jgi:ring-1,2-phenylacetyl-CoA epoxidase subunit PaaE